MSEERGNQPAGPPELPDLEKCELVEELGTSTEGPTAVVREAATGRLLVLKIYDKAVLRDPEFIERVRRDAAAVSRLSHPNVVRVLGAHEWLDDLVVVREHVDGASLAEVLAAKGKLSPTEALSVGLAVGMALEQGRQAGLCHEAVSPSNVLVARDGSVKLADLGVAKPRPIEPSISRAGAGVRSPAYLPPEHFELRAPLDCRSDLFSLGAVLYHCLSGTPPFRGDTTAEVTFAIRNGIFRPLKEAAPEAPRSFATVIEKLLQTRPADRYESPAALVEDLEAVRDHRVPAAARKAAAQIVRQKQEAARQQEAPQAAQAAVPQDAAAEVAPRGKHPWAIFALAAALLAGGAAAAFLLLRDRTRPPRRAGIEEPGEAPTTATDPMARARKAREELDTLLKAATPGKEADPAKKLQATKETLQKLKELEKKYEGTEAAADAQKRLRPLEAEAALQAALLHAREHPGDREGTAQRLREIATKYHDTAAGYSAERKLDEYEDTERKKLLAQFDQARQRARGLAAKRRFGEALAQFDEMLNASPPEATRQAILQEKIAITSEADRAYQDLHKRAQEKIAGSYYEEARALYDQVAATFGLEPYVGRAKSEIAILTPLLKSAATRRLEAIDAAKYQFFLTRLEPSLALARGWEFPAAIAEAEKVRKEMHDAGIETYLDAYLGDLALLSSLKLRVVRRLNDPADPVAVRDFSLGKIGGRFDPQWLEAKVTRADETQVLFHYGQIDVRRTWRQFLPDELYKLGILATDRADPRSHFALGVHCLYANLPTSAARELHLAKAAVPEAASYLERVELLLGLEKAAPAAGPQEQASRLLMEAKRLMNEQAWDRALYRLALLKDRHRDKVYDVSANLDEINQRIAQCKKQVEKLEIETSLALGKQVDLLRDSLFDEWQQRFGKWALDKGVLTGTNTEDHDAECLFSLRHPAAYELRAKVKITEGAGAVLRLAGKGRPNIGFWLNVAKPDLTGLLYAQPTDQQPDERKTQPFALPLGQECEVRAVVSPMQVEVTIAGQNYLVRMPNKLTPDPQGVQTYGFLVNPKTTAEFRDFSIRPLQEQ